ncbi:MAG: glycyl-tRNA synthetase beta chain [Nitrospirae bacterium]|nr:MAG: glycyl-tRNA synthetase beta chain [Nitrospirota bacterium]
MTTAPENIYPWLLLEIGTEEIPARFLPHAIERLKELSEALFSEYRIPCGRLRAYGTPRRLVLISELAPSQIENEKEVWGPPVSVAFDTDGNPTKAAEAFARSTGIEVFQLERREKGKGFYLFAQVKEASNSTVGLLPELLPKIILALNFPKSMRWGNSEMRFARPIHWILAMYQNERVKFEIEGIKSKALTRGHRFLSPAAFEVKEDRAYINLLRNNLVVVDPDERKKMILEGALKLTESVDGVLVEDDALLTHVVFLVEYPLPVLGTFDPEYLSLPEELLITVMKDHQKYFAVRGNDRRLTNHFIVVGNTRSDNADVVKKGAEKVLRARFEDARFYFKSDRKTTIAERQEKLKSVTFHAKLGTVHEKALRIASIARFIAEKCSPSKAAEAECAALICKNDLVAGVVFEFPELQGVMASYYAAETAEYSAEAVHALREQYLPAFSGDHTPETDLGAVLSLADKFDNVASFFMIGLSPSGTEDPFALRRQVIGIIAILSQIDCNLRVADILEKALQAYPGCDKAKIIDDVLKFFEQRLDPLLQSHGYAYDIVAAVIGFVRTEPVSSMRARADALVELKKTDGYESFLQLIRRVNNIAPKRPMPEVRAELFVQDEEKILWSEFLLAKPSIDAAVAAAKYAQAIEIIKTLASPVNIFFDKVLVMDKDETMKENRLALIQALQETAFSVADFSKLA